jgi:hypothetical protein
VPSRVVGRSRLELRYRRVLRILPGAYRVSWEEEMVDTFLASAPPGASRPSAPEALSVLALAVRLRLGGLRTDRSLALAEALRFLALSVLLLQVVLGSIQAGAVLWYNGLVPASPHPSQDPSPWIVGIAVTLLMPVLWLIAYVVTLLDRRSGRVLIVLTSLLGIGLDPLRLGRTVLRFATTFSSPALDLLTAVVIALPVLGAAAFHRDAPPLRARPWWIALAAGLPVAWVLAYLTRFYSVMICLDLEAAWFVLATAGLLVWLARRGSGRPFGLGWVLALTVLASVAPLLRLLALAGYLGLSGAGGVSWPVVQAGALDAAVFLVLGVVVAWSTRRSAPAAAGAVAA